MWYGWPISPDSKLSYSNGIKKRNDFRIADGSGKSIAWPGSKCLKTVFGTHLYVTSNMPLSDMLACLRIGTICD